MYKIETKDSTRFFFYICLFTILIQQFDLIIKQDDVNPTLFPNSRRGVCQELQDLEREELQTDFLSPLRFLHQGPGSRSHAGLKGGKMRTDPPGTLSGTSLGLYRILAIPGNSTVTVHQVCCVWLFPLLEVCIFN